MRRLAGALRRHGDVLVALGFAVLMSLELLSRPHGDRASVLAGCLVSTLPLAARRRLPLTSYLLVLAGLVGLYWSIPDSYADSAMFLVVSVFAPFSLGAHARGRQFWWSVVAIGVSIWLGHVGDGSPLSAGTLMFFLAFIGVPWASGVGLRLYRERKNADAARARELLAHEAARHGEALEAERAQVARDLHDVVSHAMTVTLMQARGGRRMLSVDPLASRAAFDAIERTNMQALGDMRRMLNALREAGDVLPTSPQPSLRRLEPLVEMVRSAGVPVELLVDGDLDLVPPGVDVSAFRVIQEALTNVIKHAGPARASVGVVCAADELRLNVADDGGGPSTPSAAGFGLAGIQERVAVIGGEVHFGAGRPSGFVLTARLPYAVRS
jgi:signal transduction histidine kinase